MSGHISFLQYHSTESSRVLLLCGIVIHIAMLLSLQLRFLDRLFDDATHRTGKGADFYAVYQAAQNVRDGVSIYERTPPQRVVPYFFPYRYHPIVALSIGQIFNLLPPFSAYGIWIIVLEALLFVNIVLSRRIFVEEAEANVASGIWLMFTPYFLELYMGQFSFVMASLLFWMLLAEMKQRTKLSNMFWIASLLIKSSSVLLVPVLLKVKQWRTVLVAGAIAAGLGLPYFLIVPGSLEAFSANVTEPLTMPTLAGNQGLAALAGVLVLRLGGNWPDSIYEVPDRLAMLNEAMIGPTVALTFAVVLFTAFMTIKTPPKHSLELFLLWVLAYFLFYKHVWEHHYVMMLPVFVLLYYRMKAGAIILSRKIVWTSFLFIALPTVFVFIDKASGLNDPEFYWSAMESILFHTPKPIAALTLYVALCITLWNAGSEASQNR